MADGDDTSGSVYRQHHAVDKSSWVARMTGVPARSLFSVRSRRGREQRPCEGGEHGENDNNGQALHQRLPGDASSSRRRISSNGSAPL